MLDGSAPEAYLLIKLDCNWALRLCHCYPNDLLKNTEYLFLLLLRAPHLIMDLCSLLFLKFRLLWLKSLSVLASAQWHKINPHIKKRTTKLVKLHWGMERKSKNALLRFENTVCSTAIKGNAKISWYYPCSPNCGFESAVTHSSTPGAGEPSWVWCPGMGETQTPCRSESMPWGTCKHHWAAGVGRGKHRERFPTSVLLLLGDTSHQTPAGLLLPTLAGLAETLELPVQSRVSVSIFLPLPPPPPGHGDCRGMESWHSLDAWWAEVLQVPFLVNCFVSKVLQSKARSPCASLLALGLLEVPGWCARNAPHPQRWSIPGPAAVSHTPVSARFPQDKWPVLQHVPLWWGLVAALLLCSFKTWHLRNGQKPTTLFFFLARVTNSLPAAVKHCTWAGFHCLQDELKGSAQLH